MRLLVVLSVLGWATMAAAAPLPVPTGTWKPAVSTADLEQALERSVEDAAKELSAVIRPMARDILRRVARPCADLVVWQEGDAVAVRCDGQIPAIARPDGQPVPYTGRDGRTHTLVMEHDGQRLVQRFITSTGTRTTTFLLQGDVLQVDVELASRRLRQPVRYSLTYR